MRKHHTAKDFIEFCFEKTLVLLCKQFPNSHIWIVVPSKYMYTVVCIYKNFIKTESIVGVPEHTCDFDGLEHLVALFKSMQNKMKQKPIKTDSLVIVGFSKGCVVLNQMLYEISAMCNAEGVNHSNDVQEFVQKIKAMYWLDGGHSGDDEVYVTSIGVLEGLTKLMKSVKFFVHTSPYQTEDPSRPWKGEMKNAFVRQLKEKGFDVVDKHHFEGQDISIMLHFNVLTKFK